MYSKSDIDAVKLELLHELTPAKGRGVYICPACGRARVYNPTATIWFCQRCRAKGDIFSAVRLRDGVTIEAAFATVMERYGHGQAANVSPARPQAAPAPADRGKQVAAETWRADCRRYLLAAAEALPGSAGEAYMQGRGFTSETLRRFGVGYDAKAKAHGALRFGRPAIVYPYSRRMDYYGLRFLRPIVDADGNVTKTMKPPAGRAGGEPLFNSGTLRFGFDAVIVVEGPLDCMALAQGASQVGAKVGAMALCGTGAGRLIDQLTAKPTAAKLLIALDNDEAGRSGAVALAEKLDAIGQEYEVMNTEVCFATLKDPAEVLEMNAGLMGEIVNFMLHEPAARL